MNRLSRSGCPSCRRRGVCSIASRPSVSAAWDWWDGTASGMTRRHAQPFTVPWTWVFPTWIPQPSIRMQAAALRILLSSENALQQSATAEDRFDEYL